MLYLEAALRLRRRHRLEGLMDQAAVAAGGDPLKKHFKSLGG